MSKEVRAFRIFIASPDDVAEERQIVSDIVRELNDAGIYPGVRLEVIAWENLSPGFGIDVQDVLNKQIGDDYDLFVGIMWAKGGRPTRRAPSGTIEEFDRAKARFDQDPNSLDLLFYFKTAAVPYDRIDPEQIIKVREFKARVANCGLYCDFKKAKDFQEYFRRDLARHTYKWTNSLSTAESPQRPSAFSPSSALDEDDSGLFDLFDRYEERLRTATDVANRIADAIKELGENVGRRNKTLAALQTPPHEAMGKIREALQGAAEDLDTFIAQTQDDIPEFRAALADSTNALIRYAAIAVEDGLQAKLTTALANGLSGITIIRNAILGAQSELKRMRTTIVEFPRFSTPLNQAKHRAGKLLANLLEDMTSACELLDGAEEVLRNALE